MATKTFTIIKFRKDTETPVTGTLEELTKYFGYTLESGASYNSSINCQPKTAKGLVSALNRSMAELQRGSYNPTFFELAQ